MKKLKQAFKKKPETEKKSTRITNETIAEHRERVIAEGRRFKYPVQYTKNRLVFNAVIVGLLALIIVVVFCWWQLYKVQSTADFFYRLTRIIPVPVANVDGRNVKYGDYLLNYRTSEVYLNTVENTEAAGDGSGKEDKSKYDYYKVQAMKNVVADGYAEKLAEEKGISVSTQDVEAAINVSRQTASDQGSVSEAVFNRSVERIYGISPSELRYYLKKRLVRQDVEYAIDTKAKQSSDTIQETLKKQSKQPFDKLIVELNKKLPVKAQVLVSGWVSKDNKDGGIAAAAAKLKKGEFTGPIKPASGDGYYFIKLLDMNKSDEINYQYIKVPLTEFTKQLDALYKQNKVKYYISLPAIDTQDPTK